jgi:hypothetical protein
MPMKLSEYIESLKTRRIANAAAREEVASQIAS